MEQDTVRGVLEQLPNAGVMAVFAWVLLQVVRQTIVYYQGLIEGSLAKMLALLSEVEERTKACVLVRKNKENEQ